VNKKLLAKEIAKVAGILVGMEFPSEDALKKYLEEHPESDKSHHTVKKHEEKPTGETEEKPVEKPTEKTEEKPEHKTPAKKIKPHAESLKKVSDILDANGLSKESDEVKELVGFKQTLGKRIPDKDIGKWYVRNVDKLKKDFIANMSSDNYSSPEAFKSAQDRVKKMTKGDFAKVLAAIDKEDEEGELK